jgi:hypothetical protein
LDVESHASTHAEHVETGGAEPGEVDESPDVAVILEVFILFGRGLGSGRRGQDQDHQPKTQSSEIFHDSVRFSIHFDLCDSKQQLDSLGFAVSV